MAINKNEAQVCSSSMSGVIILSVKLKASHSHTHLSYKVTIKLYEICITTSQIVIQMIHFLNFQISSSDSPANTSLRTSIRK